jgi:uncharacterized protein (TIGR02145 family)
MRPTLIALALLICKLLNAQAPALIPYQAIARNAAGEPLASSTINARFTIHDGTAAGASVWQELQTVTTTSLGLFTVQLGSSVSLSSVNWSNSAKFMQVEIDLDSGFVDIGTQQLLSVPYALYSGAASNGVPSGGEQGQVLTNCNGLPTWTNNGLCPGAITDLNCASATNQGSLTAGTAASSVSSTIAYTGGNGGVYSPQSVVSTGVTGLTAALTAGTLASGAGSVTYTITGTPSASGTASFALSLGGQSCTFTRTVSSAAGGGGSSATCGAANVHNPNLTYGTMTDQEGNVYKTIVIGTQEWMAENLNTSIYRNGDAIPTNLDNAAWQSTTSGAWAYYNNDASYACPYGKLYNWYTCVDARQLCPTGWHVPTDAEWIVLTNYLDGESVAGGKMKTTGTIEAATGLWYSPNVEATNSSGFSGAPGGLRILNGEYGNIGYFGYWWSSSELDSFNAWNHLLDFSFGTAFRNFYNRRKGFSVRCLRD